MGLSGAGRGKVRTQSKKKSATSLYSQSAKGKRTKHSTSSRATGSRYTEKRQSPRPRGRGGGRGMGVFTRPLGRRDPTGRRPAKSRPARRPAAPLSLSAVRPAPGARATWRPRALCAARSAPASGLQPGGSAAGRAGGGEAGRLGGSRCPPAGRGARVAQGRRRGERAAAPQSRDPGRRGRERRGTGAAHRPGWKRGVPSEGRAPELRAAHTLASDSWQP